MTRNDPESGKNSVGKTPLRNSQNNVQRLNATHRHNVNWKTS